MSKNILIKLFICIISIIIISSSFCLSVSHALGDIFSSGADFLKDGNSIDKTLNTTELKTTSDNIYNTLFGIAVMIAIIVAMVLGIQFMAASADEKAKVKEAILPFVVGCIVVFGSFTIWKISVNIGNSAESEIVETKGWITPPVSGYICDFCNEDVGGIPSGVIAGSRDYWCPKCGKKIVEGGNITHAHQ